MFGRLKKKRVASLSDSTDAPVVARDPTAPHPGDRTGDVSGTWPEPAPGHLSPQPGSPPVTFSPDVSGGGTLGQVGNQPLSRQEGFSGNEVPAADAGGHIRPTTSLPGDHQDLTQAARLLDRARKQAREVLLLADEEVRRQQSQARNILRQAEDEAAWLRRSAREHATQVRSDAGTSADALLRDAKAKAEKITGEALAMAEETSRTAETMLAEAQREVDRLRLQAHAELEKTREAIGVPLQQLATVRDFSREFQAQVEYVFDLLNKLMTLDPRNVASTTGQTPLSGPSPRPETSPTNSTSAGTSASTLVGHNAGSSSSTGSPQHLGHHASAEPAPLPSIPAPDEIPALSDRITHNGNAGPTPPGAMKHADVFLPDQSSFQGS